MTASDITGTPPRRTWVWLATISLLAVVAGILMPIIHFMVYHTPIQSPLYKFIYSAGALVLLIARIMTSYNGKNARIKRLVRLETWSSAMFCVAAFFLFYNKEESTRDWIAFTLAGGALLTYTSIMIPIALRREMKKLTEQS